MKFLSTLLTFMNSIYAISRSHPGWGWLSAEGTVLPETAPVELTARATRAWPLAPGETLRLEVTRGTLWATQTGHSDDWILHAPVTQEFTGPGLVVIEALTASAALRLSKHANPAA